MRGIELKLAGHTVLNPPKCRGPLISPPQVPQRISPNKTKVNTSRNTTSYLLRPSLQTVYFHQGSAISDFVEINYNKGES